MWRDHKMKENKSNLKTYFIILIIVVALLIILAFYKINFGNSQLLKEHCAMLPGADGCEKYLGQYTETSQTFTRSIEGLSLVKESTIYETSKDKVGQLEINPVKKEIDGKEIRMYGYNSQIPGPLIKVNQEETIFVNVTNNLDMETTVHWHGIRLKNKFDGAPMTTQEAIQPGKSFLYQLNFPDAGTYSYHQHASEDYYNKVNREEFIFLDDIQLSGGDITPVYKVKINQVLMGWFGNVMLINGK